jgi:hypothetical protein
MAVPQVNPHSRFDVATWGCLACSVGSSTETMALFFAVGAAISAVFSVLAAFAAFVGGKS